MYRWDWFDGSNGTPRVDFYLDGKLLFTSKKNIPRSPAQLWVGNWPAPWSGDFRYSVQHLYVDWVKITEIRTDFPARSASGYLMGPVAAEDDERDTG